MKLHIDREAQVPLYYQLSEQIKQAIASQQLPPGTKIPTERELMREYDLSYPTVTRAMRELVNEGVIERKQGKGSFVKEAATVAPPINKILGFILCGDLTNGVVGPFYSQVFTGSYDTAMHSGYGIQIFNVTPQHDLAIVREQLYMNGVRGLFQLPFMPPTSIKTLSDDYPTVLIDYSLQDAAIDAVVSDNYTGARMAMRHLMELGHRRIGYIGQYWDDFGYCSTSDRYRGYRDAMVEAGTAAPELVVRGKNSFDRGYSAMKTLLALPHPPTAVFAHNDETALSAMEAALNAGLTIPRDISFIGFDDVEVAAQADIPLSTIRVPKRRMGVLGAKKLIAQVEGQPSSGKTVLTVELIIRQSTGEVPVAPVASTCTP